MRLALAMAGLLLLLLQNQGSGVAGPVAEPQHLRYERAIVLPAAFAGGPACAVLDTTTLAHAASRSGDDLRVFEGRDARQAETPFALTESEAAPGDAEPATVQNLTLRDGAIDFNLIMPHRPYTEIDLQLAAKNFVGTAEVRGLDSEAAKNKPGSSRVALGSSGVALGSSGASLGSFAIFDLSAQGLARSTSLPLQESSFPVLHVQLRLRGVDGRPLAGLATTMVESADVPPSREAQTLYTAVAATDSISQQGAWTMAKIHVPAHVPVERVSFALAPGSARNFLRDVTVVAKPDVPAGQIGIVAAEAVDGEIWREARPRGVAGGPAIHADKLSMDAVLASNLRAPATVTVVVKNGSLPPLPLREIELQMRERKVCFTAAPGQSYVLRYGDPGLGPPVYEAAEPASAASFPNSATSANVSGGTGQSRLRQPSASPVTARLGPERTNPQYVARSGELPYTERHPEVLWLALLVGTTVLGTVASQSVNRRGGN